MESSKSSESASFENFTFRRLDVNDYDKVMVNLRHSFVLDEPISRIFGFCEKRFASMGLGIRELLIHNLSYAGFDKTTQNIAGLVLNVPNKKTEELEVVLPSRTSPGTIRQFLTRVEDKLNVYEKFGVTEYGEIFIVSVHRDHRGQGLATELFRRSFDIFRQNGYIIVKCTATSPFTRNICAKLGFIEVGSWKYSEVKDKAGNAIIGNISEDEDGIVAHAVFKL